MSQPDQPLEVSQEIGLYPIVQDSSCELVISVRDPRTGEEPYQPPLVLPYPLARALHDHLGQYLARQQVFDREFRNQPE